METLQLTVENLRLNMHGPELQIQQLRKHTAGGFHVYAYGNRIIPEHETFLKKCDEVTFISSESTPNGEFDHVWPLRNWLTRQAIKTHKIIVHLDSDAFPVNDNWLNRYNQKLSLCSPRGRGKTTGKWR